ncbi:hypothetical protein L593_04965 [Salinarchaeum sp. Harcht-Bsk1]|nr:hypothetical protein L593_04965 [Salinarchaeum sp. Harcht-Bsk1]
MDWFSNTIPQGTVFTTHRIATEIPGLISELADQHEIGVHVHPKEFGYDHDQLAELPPNVQSEVISSTRGAIADAIGVDPDSIRSFRAGRHSASEATIEILRDLGFLVDASVNMRYTQHLPSSITQRSKPFNWDGIFEIPTTFDKIPLFSRYGLRGTVTATANTLKTDRLLCSGTKAIKYLLSATDFVSFYMHPFDAISNNNQGGAEFRQRVERLFSTSDDKIQYITASEYARLRLDSLSSEH